MRYKILATDYDGTLAQDGAVHETTVAALERFRESGGRVILVTGRELGELLALFPRIDLCDRVVAENGGLLFDPRSGTDRALASPPPRQFLDALRGRGVDPLAVGRVVVATWVTHLTAVRETIHELSLDSRVILNKRSVMVLPAGIDKASGLAAALADLGETFDVTAGVGDAENDLDLLESCGLAVAVANALPMLKRRADFVTESARGAGVVELIDRLLNDEFPTKADGRGGRRTG